MLYKHLLSCFIAAALGSANARTVKMRDAKRECNKDKKKHADSCSAVSNASKVFDRPGLMSVTDVSVGQILCEDVFDHETTWVLQLGENDFVTAQRTYAEHNGGFLVWIGDIVDEGLKGPGTVTVTWAEADPCNVNTFGLTVSRGYTADGRSIAYEGTAATGKRKDGSDFVIVKTTRAREQPRSREEHSHTDGNARHFHQHSPEENTAADPEPLQERTIDGVYPAGLQDASPCMQGSDGNYVCPQDEAEFSSSNVAEKSGQHRQLQTSYTYVDVMMLYTPGALGTSGPENVLRTEVTKANEVMSNTGINVRFRLVYWGETTYNPPDSEDSRTTLNAISSGLVRTASGTAIALSKVYGADIVTVVRRSLPGNNCGEANDIPGRFTVVSNTCLYLYTNVHEWGHCLGARHNVPRDQTPGSAHGYISCGLDLIQPPHRTIMSYDDCTNHFAREKYFSTTTPYVPKTPGGVIVFGVKGQSENDLAIKSNAPGVAAYRTSGYDSSGINFKTNVDNMFISKPGSPIDMGYTSRGRRAVRTMCGLGCASTGNRDVCGSDWVVLSSADYDSLIRYVPEINCFYERYGGKNIRLPNGFIYKLEGRRRFIQGNNCQFCATLGYNACDAARFINVDQNFANEFLAKIPAGKDISCADSSTYYDYYENRFIAVQGQPIYYIKNGFKKRVPNDHCYACASVANRNPCASNELIFVSQAVFDGYLTDFPLVC